MIPLQKDDILGYYYPAFFSMFVNTDESFNSVDISEETLDTFNHEYIHFLQDLFTIYGLRNVSEYVNHIYKYNQKIINDPEHHIIFKTSDSEISRLEAQQGFHLGTANFSDFDEITEYKFEDCDFHGHAFQMVDVTCQKGKDTDNFYFGYLCIMESMVHIIEKERQVIIPRDKFPYKMVDLIIDKFFSGLRLDNLMRIAICEEALNSSHPGVAFFRILDGMKEKNQYYSHPGDFHRYCKKNTLLKTDDKTYKINEYFNEILDLFVKNLKIYFNEKSVIKINEWVDKTKQSIINLRKDDFHFYKLINNDYIDIVRKRVGTPLVKTNNNYYFLNPEIDQANFDIVMFEAIHSFYEIVSEMKVGCSLIKYCKSNIKIDLVNENCSSKPWMNSLRRPLCYFGALWYSWGLSDFIKE